eukprot:6554532-Prymnesium_polylepis.1
MQTPRYGPRGGAPCRNVTSTRRCLGPQRAESTCPAQRAAAQRDNDGRPPRRTVTGESCGTWDRS